MTVVLGLDPGSISLGYGLIELRGGSVRHLAHGEIRASKSMALPRRLALLHTGLAEVLDRYEPAQVSLERVFLARNPAAALTLGQARGMILLAVGQRELTLAEYSPGAVKLAVGGHGRSRKEEVATMVGRLLGVSLAGSSSDSTDALALALCHVHHMDRERMLAKAARGPKP
jgi:crossover junction endodeoxyribonuclease RuvC